MGKTTFGSHDFVRGIDRQGEILIRRSKCPGYARQRMGPKLMNCCKPEPMGTQGHGKMLKRIQTLEDGRIPAWEAQDLMIEGRKRRITRKEYQGLVNKQVWSLTLGWKWPDVTDVLVSPSSVVTEFCDGFFVLL